MDRFWSKVDKGKFNECWEWQGAISNGYGQFCFDGNKSEGAHRVAMMLCGIEPEDEMVLHYCDNTSCVNPGHLYVGDAKDNRDDAVNRNRIPVGEEHHSSKLSAKNVMKIRSKYKGGGCSQNDLAEEYDVSRYTIRKILNRETWAHID